MKRKSPKHIIAWEEKFSDILKLYHGNYAKKVFHRLMKKSSTLRNTLKRRSKEYAVLMKISLEEIRNLLYKSYGTICKYCNKRLLVNNIVCDHNIPLSLGGESTIKNLQIICRTCNTRKGPLTHEEYFHLIKWLNEQDEGLKKYVYRKLSQGDSIC
jgi:5-methylcytosine-specific restriction endonuclease McrA